MLKKGWRVLSLNDVLDGSSLFDLGTHTAISCQYLTVNPEILENGINMKL